MRLQALIFDVDGTVAETADLQRQSFNQAFAEHGLGWHWDREIFAELTPVKFALPKLRMFLSAVRQAQHCHLPSHEVLAKIALRKAQIYCDKLREGAAYLRPGVARLISEASHDGLALAAVSTHTRTEVQTLLFTNLGFSSISQFSTLKTAEDITGHAPEAALYRAVLRDLGLRGSQCVAVVDGSIGEKAATRNGISVLATPGLYTSSNRFAASTLVVSDLGQPAEPFTALQGEAGQQGYISPATLERLISPKAAAA